MSDVTEGRTRPPLPLIFAVTVTGVTVNTLVAPGIPDILDGLGASRGLAGLVIAGATFPGALLAPVIGILADRYGRRTVLVPCLLLYGVAGGLAGLAPALWVLVVLRFFQGAGAAGLINLGVVLIGDHWDGPDRARMLGRNAAVLTIAVAIFPVLGGALTDLGGWRAPFAVYPLALLTAAGVYRYLPRGERRDVTVRGQVAAALPYLRMRLVASTLVAGVLFFIVLFGMILTVLPLYMESRFGLGAGVRGIVLGLPAVTSTLASLVVGGLVARFGLRRILVAGAGIFAASLVGIAASPLLLLVGAGVLVFGLGQGLLIPTLQDVTAGVPPAESRGSVVAMWVSSVRTGQTIGPLVASPIFTAGGGPVTFLFGAGVSVALLALLAFGSKGADAAIGDEPSAPPA